MSRLPLSATGMMRLPSERAIASSAKHHWEAADAELNTNSTASARRSSRVQLSLPLRSRRDPSLGIEVQNKES